MKRFITVIIATAIYICLGAQKPKYIFYFIGDGMSLNGVYATELYNAAAEGKTLPKELTFSSFPYRGWITTHNSESLVTDSAAAGTALSCGEKSFDGGIGVNSKGEKIESITSKLKGMGFGTAIITTVGINHATPAAFYANNIKRSHYLPIFEQLLAEDKVDFIAGADIMKRKKDTVSLELLASKAEDAGWTLLMGDACKTRAEESRKTMCIDKLGCLTLDYCLDGTRTTTLADYTRAAVKNMEKYHPEGFFMMIEGGTIDHAAHAGDAVTMIWEVNDMDRAVDVAMETYRAHPDETLIIVTADHETGGLSTASRDEYALHYDKLLHQKISLSELTRRIGALRMEKNPTWEQAKAILKDALGLWDHVSVSQHREGIFKEIFQKTIIEQKGGMDENLYSTEEKLATEAVRYLDAKAGVLFTTNEHSGAPVPLFCIGCGAEKIAACRDNTQIPQVIMKLTR